MVKGTTWDQFGSGDVSYLFRKQNKRTLDEVDILLRR
jgi:hypothetical protein